MPSTPLTRLLSFMSLTLRVQSHHMWSQGLVEDGRPVRSLSKGKQSLVGEPWRRERRGGQSADDGTRPVRTIGHRTPRGPGSGLSRTGRPWSRGNNGTADGGGTCRRSDSAASRCRTLELRRQSKEGRGDRRGGGGWLIDHSAIGRRRTSTGRFMGHKLPLLVPSAPLCVLRARLTRLGGRSQGLRWRREEEEEETNNQGTCPVWKQPTACGCPFTDWLFTTQEHRQTPLWILRIFLGTTTGANNAGKSKEQTKPMAVMRWNYW